MVDNDKNMKKKGATGGPKNIMNELDYKIWLRFLKSFDIYSDKNTFNIQLLTEDYIRFFTKSASKVLTNIPDVNIDGREIVYTNLDKIPQKQQYDYIILNMMDITSDWNWDRFYKTISKCIKENGYITLFLCQSNKGSPNVWNIAKSARTYLQLCDEKVILFDNTSDKKIYSIQLRKHDELDWKVAFDDGKLTIAPANLIIPQFIIPRPPARKKNEILHPAKFPEDLIEIFIRMFTHEGDWIIDPMAGTCSTLIAAYNLKRNSIGIELGEKWYKLGKGRLIKLNPSVRLPGYEAPAKSLLILGDARETSNLVKEKCQYCITSPPYWNVLQNKGSEGQRKRRNQNLDLKYGDKEADLGNIESYDEFLNILSSIYNDQIAKILTTDGNLTIVIKNVKQGGYNYPLAWDLTEKLAGPDGKYSFIGYTLWCQDDIGLKPFAIGHHWVSNILHQYCLHFQVRPK